MNLFQSFLWGGFECADHINRSGDRVNLLAETAHDIRVREDYGLLEPIGIRTVREGICWSRVERRPFVYDFSEVRKRLEVGQEMGIQQVWDMCHFGYPDDLVPTHPRFTERFVALCREFAAVYRRYRNDRMLVVPINEISFLSWHSGDVRGTVPFAVHSGFDIKYHLCKAAIAAINAFKEVDPDCRILTVEPLVAIHPKTECSPDDAELRQANENQFQAMDMIAGRMCPELGGSPGHLDICGFNYYHNCQWEQHGEPLPWPSPGNGCQRIPLSRLLQEVWERYRRPMLLSETGHFGEHRAQWLKETLDECDIARRLGVDLSAVCIYPLIDRPDWDNLSHYSRSGLWDLDARKNRVPEPRSLELLATVAGTLSESSRQPEMDVKHAAP